MEFQTYSIPLKDGKFLKLELNEKKDVLDILNKLLNDEVNCTVEIKEKSLKDLRKIAKDE